MSTTPDDTRDVPADPDEAGTDWDRDRDGRMADYATDDDAVFTVPWKPGA